MGSKLRTKDAFFRAIDEDKAWRDKELAALRSAVDRQPDSSRFLIRASIPILYSHWEGFVKKSGASYLDFVTGQGIQYSQLAVHLLALATRKRCPEIYNAKTMSLFLEIANFYTTELSESASLIWDKAFSTSNLNSEVLYDMTLTLGIAYAPFEPFKVLIDEKLLKQRNEIAHGQTILINKADFFELHDEVQKILEIFRNEIQNAVAVSNYLKK